MKAIINLNSDEACKTNTGRAQNKEGRYDVAKLASICGARFEDILYDLDWCARNKYQLEAIQTIKRLGNALLATYEILESSY